MLATFYLLMTFYLADGSPIEVQRQAINTQNGYRPVRKIEDCLALAIEQRRRFLYNFAKTNYTPFMDVRIECEKRK